MRNLIVISCYLFLLGCTHQTQEREPYTPAPVVGESNRLNAWLDEQYAEELDSDPMQKTRLGEKSDYDLLNDFSEAALEQQLRWRIDSVATMKAVFNYEALSEEARTSYDMWVYSLDRALDAKPFRRHAYIFGRGGPHVMLPNFMINFHKVDDPSDMHAYIARLEAIQGAMHQYLARAKLSVADGIRQPRFDYEFAINEIGRVMRGEPFGAESDSPLWADIKRKTASLQATGKVSAEEVRQLRAAARAALVEKVKPAYDKVLAWLQSDIDQAPNPPVGAWALPNGLAYYKQRLRHNTTLDLSAEEIHQTGLEEVARLRGEMEALKQRVGFAGTLQQFFVFIRKEPRFYLPNSEEGRNTYLDLARGYLNALEKKLPDYFGILPKAGLEVRRVEAFREQDGAAQHYRAGTPDGSRPGVFYAHLSDMRAMPTYQLEDVAYHEGVPGHHMQISIQQELTDVPRFRTQYRTTAFTEGWALYSELLAREMGAFEDPYSDFGRLVGETWRAIRLVVDTGIHAKKWSEEQAVKYFSDNSPQPEATIRSEIMRYIHNPGQATAYKMGMLKILELRTGAKKALGDKFDLRQFHDVVLSGGALPMPVLEKRVMRWVEAQKSATSRIY
ncbi:MAG: DUF885 domain-containing protein [Gammaproteobacteria bacterium]|nr:DUF885 domain-containing protein [Gammaproteobacteria bacterium]